MKTFIQTIAANSEIQINQPGRAVFIKSSAVDLTLSDDTNGFDVEVSQGDTYLAEKAFNSLVIRNSSAGSITVIISVGNGRLIKAPPTSLTVSNASSLVSTADVALSAAVATVIKAANSSRKSIYITNLTGAAIRVGDSSVTATRGHYVPNNGGVVLECTGAVYGYSVAGGSVSVLELQ